MTPREKEMQEIQKTGVATRLFINGLQIGSDSTYMDYYPTIEEAESDTRRFFEQDGYRVESIEIENLPRWESTAPVPTLVVRLLKP